MCAMHVCYARLLCVYAMHVTVEGMLALDSQPSMRMRSRVCTDYLHPRDVCDAARAR